MGRAGAKGGLRANAPARYELTREDAAGCQAAAARRDAHVPGVPDETRRQTRGAAVAVRRVCGGRVAGAICHHPHRAADVTGQEILRFAQDDKAGCPFCELPDERCFYSAELVRAVWDRFPVSPGHALVVPRRHVASFFDATAEERGALLGAVERVRAEIEKQHAPDGYNIGVNVSAAAGQTIAHVHLHVIPRYTGDVPDPRGGVRNVIPGKGNWLTTIEGGAPHQRSIVTGAVDDPLLPHLVSQLDRATRVDIAVAFTLEGGARTIEEYLRPYVTPLKPGPVSGQQLCDAEQDAI